MIQDDKLPLKEKFLVYFRQLPVQKLACNYIGRTEDTISLWKGEDSDFSDQIDKAKADWALENAGQVKSREWLLERVMKNHFAERKQLVGGDDDEDVKPIMVKFINDKDDRDTK